MEHQTTCPRGCRTCCLQSQIPVLITQLGTNRSETGWGRSAPSQLAFSEFFNPMQPQESITEQCCHWKPLLSRIHTASALSVAQRRTVAHTQPIYRDISTLLDRFSEKTTLFSLVVRLLKGRKTALPSRHKFD